MYIQIYKVIRTFTYYSTIWSTTTKSKVQKFDQKNIKKTLNISTDV